MELLENLIKAMDTTTAQAAEIRVFRLQNADARQMGDLITQLFKLTAANGNSGGTTNQRIFSYQLVPDTSATTQPGATTKPAAVAGATAVMGTADQQALNVTTDVRTNSLVISGTHRQVDLCSDVIRDLDASPAQERHTELYRLRNAQAVDIQLALRTFLDQERQHIVEALGQDKIGDAQRMLESEVAVVAEKTSNTLLISGSPRYFDTIKKMILELDEPQPQVMIQVMLAEVTLNEETDLGFEWTLSKNGGLYKGSVGTGPLVGPVTTVGPPQIPVSPTISPASAGLGVADALAKNGGFSAFVTGGDLSLLMRALQTQSKVEVLSRPEILAADNQPAEIIVGQQVPIITGSTSVTLTSGLPGVVHTITYQNVGITRASRRASSRMGSSAWTWTRKSARCRPRRSTWATERPARSSTTGRPRPVSACRTGTPSSSVGSLPPATSPPSARSRSWATSRCWARCSPIQRRSSSRTGAADHHDAARHPEPGRGGQDRHGGRRADQLAAGGEPEAVRGDDQSAGADAADARE